jgi:isocitrate/isopropylmalate dehydrogenase
MILTIKLMLDWLGEERKGRALEKAVATVIAEGSVRTYDMGGKSSTYDMAGAVTERYKEMIGA